ncbi:hypothetical protein HanXRQr2_Chr03g0102041 [Helianthus annuus]|uniref:Uncharacterized protein n=1 Tax=Helianthus annuus TaxID=4232 RepID=A0A9K3JE03_HELAN|nr:hypothetical protein HanXRQr2_Chr03g0102031 [Helianthus annuus]KAF5813721.1 hypothetical protein HanXRQr2_Chr03g0102041 [Helianthus annuus]
MYLHAHLDILGGFHRIILINSKLSQTLSTFLKSMISSPPSKSPVLDTPLPSLNVNGSCPSRSSLSALNISGCIT